MWLDVLGRAKDAKLSANKTLPNVTHAASERGKRVFQQDNKTDVCSDSVVVSDVIGT